MTFGAAGAASADAKPAADYDRFVDWDRRLAREAPFYRREFEAHRVQRVIDVGAGSAMHASMWAKWGLDVAAVEPAPSMFVQAEHNIAAALPEITAAGGAVELVAAGFGELAGLGLQTADAVTCTGNALPHIDGQDALVPTLRDFASVLRPGGLLVLHLLNHDRLLAGKIRAIPPKVRDDEEGRWVFLRVMDYVEDAIRFDFLTMHKPVGQTEASAWEMSARSSLHTALPSELLVRGLEGAGFGDVRLLGDHEGAALQPEKDESVIVTAVRA